MKKLIAILFVLNFTKALASDDYVVLNCKLQKYLPDATIEVYFDRKVLFMDGYNHDLKEDKLYLIGTRGSDERVVINRYDLTGVWQKGTHNIDMSCTKLKKKI